MFRQFAFGLAVFFSSACGLVIEIVAGRLIAPYVGMSLYTWTAIIAVVLAGLSASKGQARKDIAGGGISLNNRRCGDAAQRVTTDDLLFARYLLLRKGRKHYALLDAGPAG